MMSMTGLAQSPPRRCSQRVRWAPFATVRVVFQGAFSRSRIFRPMTDRTVRHKLALRSWLTTEHLANDPHHLPAEAGGTRCSRAGACGGWASSRRAYGPFGSVFLLIFSFFLVEAKVLSGVSVSLFFSVRV